MSASPSPASTAAAEAQCPGVPRTAVHSAADVMSAMAQRTQRELLAAIIRSYRHWLVRVYCRVRFLILRQDFLNEIGQYLTAQGKVLDIGCGFGLFALYFAGSAPGRRVFGYDLKEKRIAMARLAARTVGMTNARFEPGDAIKLALDDDYDAIYALDLMHHLPADGVPDFVAGLHRALRPGGVLLVKDVDTRPAYKRWFTLLLDRLMVGWSEPICYWPREELRALLQRAGFEVYSHTMRDILPYPHMLYVCRKASAK